MAETKDKYRAGVTHDPSRAGILDRIKQIRKAHADFIDLIESIPREEDDDDINHLVQISQIAIDSGAMWAMQAADKIKLED
jgi:hypothetical protein